MKLSVRSVELSLDYSTYREVLLREIYLNAYENWFRFWYGVRWYSLRWSHRSSPDFVVLEWEVSTAETYGHFSFRNLFLPGFYFVDCCYRVYYCGRLCLCMLHLCINSLLTLALMLIYVYSS